ncbi:MAG: 3-hydroxyacyl-CoA dehydrogenase family protein [Euryarchaeota archaeon]|nr:3-hydroxyacyl-CoA dehydrogenase family protein [Euryarchaeota archaeon]
MRIVAVLGAGTMGRGIAHVAAQSGYAVLIRDVKQEFLDRGLAAVKADLDKGVLLGKITDEDRKRVTCNMTPTLSLEEAARQADLVIEAVPEDVPLKHSTYREMAPFLQPHAMLGTNTSSLSINELATGVSRPDRFVGIHFFNPVRAMKLVEVVYGAKTSKETISLAVEFAGSLGKDAIIVKDSPGFATSRLGVVIGLEAMRMLEEGVASAADIDKAMRLGYNHPMGPLELSDLVGLDVRLAIAVNLHQRFKNDRYAPPEILKRLVREGKLGKKSGEGFYKD